MLTQLQRHKRFRHSADGALQLTLSYLAAAGVERSRGAAATAAAPDCTIRRRPVSMDIIGEKAAADPARATITVVRILLKNKNLSHKL